MIGCVSGDYKASLQQPAKQRHRPRGGRAGGAAPALTPVLKIWIVARHFPARTYQLG
jgi:hypothetical protein